MTASAIQLHEEAAAEYEAAIDWYFERSPLAASKLAREVNRALDLISAGPRRWPVHTRGTRRYLLRHFPFAIIYREGSSVIQIIAVAHGQRRPGYWKARL